MRYFLFSLLFSNIFSSTVIAAPSPKVEGLIRFYEETYHLPTGLLYAVVQIESNFKSGAINGPSVGLAQVHVTTAKRFCGISKNTLLKPSSNLYCAASILKRLISVNGNKTRAALAAYQRGTACECNGVRYTSSVNNRACLNNEEPISCTRRGLFINQWYVDRVYAAYEKRKLQK
jgi:soluble lytic murein transglycosylase-like protein